MHRLKGPPHMTGDAPQLVLLCVGYQTDNLINPLVTYRIMLTLYAAQTPKGTPMYCFNPSLLQRIVTALSGVGGVVLFQELRPTLAVEQYPRSGTRP